MTYIACIINKNGIVIGSDTRANYFEDYVENGRIKGKIIKFYWDGNKKIFLLKNKFAIAAQGLLFWGSERLLLSRYIKKFEESSGEREYIRVVSQKIYNYFKNTQRKTASISEVMHLIIAGMEMGKPIGFYINTYYDNTTGIQQLPFNINKTFYVNGDGKGEYIDEIFSIEKAIDFCREEILKKHKETPFNVGDKLEILVIPATGVPYWVEKLRVSINYKNYDELMEAIKNRKSKEKMLIVMLKKLKK